MPRPTRLVAILGKRTSYRTFVEERHDARVLELLASEDPTVKRMRRSHEAHQETLGELRAALDDLGVGYELYEGARTRIEGRYSLVIAIGGDGTVLAASHQIGPDTPLLGVNSAPESSVGFFCAARKGSVKATVTDALSGALKGVTLTRMRVELNGRLLHNRVLNEALFCHASPAMTSRYFLRVQHGKRAAEEEQKSSGIWVGPSAGSTAAQRSAGGKVLPLVSTKLQFVVREPYLGAGALTRRKRGLIEPEARLELLSKMAEAKLFLDGHNDEHDVTIGDRIVLRRSDETLTILGLRRNGAAHARKRRTNAAR